MLLPARYGKCIWCTRPLDTALGEVDASPTDEHIFPQSIFGVVKTRDCCKGCNSRLGHTVDKLLLADERIFVAARDAGVATSELLSRFSGAGTDSLGRLMKYTVKGGKWRLEPRLSVEGFKIGLINGELFSQDLANAKAKMRRLVAADERLQLTSSEIDKEVDQLFQEFLSKPGRGAVYSQRIRQGIQGVRGPTHIRLDGVYDPRQTERVIAKIAYETAMCLLPPNLFAKVWSALDQLRLLVWQEEMPRLVFSHECPSPACRCHTARVNVAGDLIRFSVTLFGKQSWLLEFGVVEKGAPASLEPLELALSSEFPPGGRATGKVLVNGHDVSTAGSNCRH